MKTVWIMKANEDSNTTYVDRINEAKFSTELIATLSFNFINQSIIKDALNNPDHHSGIVFTSPRAVQALASIYKTLPISIHQQWSCKKIFVIGEATATLVKNTMSLNKLIGEESFTAKNLAPIIIGETVEFDKPLLIPCGNQKRDELPKLLVKENRDFRSIMCYETLIHPQLEQNVKNLISKENFPDFLVFFSPSGVKFALPILKKLLPNFDNVKFVAIGPTTNASLVENELNVAGVCPSPSTEGVVHVLKGL